MNTLSTHVLDTSVGKPAEGIAIVLEVQEPDGRWKQLAQGTTNADGRVADFLGKSQPVPQGLYRMSFATAAYFQRRQTKSFYPYVHVTFELTSEAEHYHVPLLLSPFGFSTYRGS